MKDSLPLSIFLIIPFIIGSVALSAMHGWNYLVVGLGVICAAVFLLASLQQGFFVSAEIKCFMAFACWSVFGIFVAVNPFIVMVKFRSLIQLVIMAMIIAFYARNIRCINWLFLGVMIGVLVITVGAVITGDFARAEMEGEEARLSGFIMNANAFGRTVTYGIAIILYFFRLVQSKLLKLIMIAALLVAIRFIIASGSRQGFLGMSILFMIWFLYSYGRELRMRPGLAILMLIGFLILSMYTAYTLRDTHLMKRLLQVDAEIHGGSRMVMMQHGIEITIDHPLFGVGLSNFSHYSVAAYAHNNYAEVFSTTGIPGGIFYHFIYVFILYRLFRVSKLSLSFASRNALNIFKAIMVVTLVLDLFIVTYYSKINWIVLAIIIGYLNVLQRQAAAGPVTEYTLDDVPENEQYYSNPADQGPSYEAPA